MRKVHLIWIIPMVFMSGMLTYSMIDSQAETESFELLGTCLAYEDNMDMVIILLQKHCLVDAVVGGNQTDFCFALQGTKPNNYEDGIIKKYHWKS